MQINRLDEHKHPLSLEDKRLIEEVAHFHDTIEYDPDYDHWCLVPALLESGDYTGSTIEVSNQKVFWNEFGHIKGVHLVGGVGYNAIYIEIDTIKDSANGIAECLKSLSDYPVLDDLHWSETALNFYLEAWDNWGRTEFINDLCRHLTPDQDSFDSWLEDLDEDTLRQFYESLIPSGEYYTEETGGVSLNIDLAIDRVTLNDLAKFVRQQ